MDEKKGAAREDAPKSHHIHLSTLKLAREYTAAGISVIPLRLDGSKSPAISSWSPYCKRLPTDEELEHWYRRPAGIGLVCGAVSGGLEVFDFDDGTLLNPWWRLVPHIAARLPIVETPSSGWHVLYRSTEIAGNSKIAMDPNREKQTLIETRGQGGYIVGEGSPPATHATGLVYAQAFGPYLPTVPTITPAERRELWVAARTFDRRPAADIEKLKRKYASAATPSHNTELHPVIAAFDARTGWGAILTPCGWTSRDGEHWTRPGKTFGTSAKTVTGKDGRQLLTVFSGNAGPLSPTGSHRTLGKFDAWCALQFNSDRRAAFAAARGAS